MKMTNPTTTEITKITIRWDDQAGVTPGWHCESWLDDEMITDSQKIWFGVEVDEYRRDQLTALKNDLHGAYPNAEIVVL